MEGVRGRLLRGVRARGATSAIIVLVAGVAVAAAVTGPAFSTAAEAAVLSDTLHGATPVGQGVEISWQSETATTAITTAHTDEAREASGEASTEVGVLRRDMVISLAWLWTLHGPG